MKKANKGFTLAELLIVVAIVAILIAIAIPIYTSAMQDAQRKVNMSNARALKGAATSYILANWTGEDGAEEYSSGATGGANAKGWIAWAMFNDDGSMGDVTVRVRYGTIDTDSVKSQGYVTKDMSTDIVNTSDVETARASAVTVESDESGSVTNSNWVIVTLTGTDINK